MTLSQLDELLTQVQKPSRYAGGEVGSVVKTPTPDMIRYAFCFPDLYEIGMSHLGMKILYYHANRRNDVWCERVFSPDADMEALMREKEIPLYGLESFDPIRSFDLIGFTLQYEMCYTGVLNMLDLAGIPIKSRDRNDDFPIVIAGGTCACNPEPMADFIDVFSLGEGEEVSDEVFDCIKMSKQRGLSKKQTLKELSKIEGLYVPGFYEVSYNDDGTIKDVRADQDAPMVVKKRIIKDLDKVFFPSQFVVPFIDIVHDRAVVEVFRGCPRGCRFCQAGFIYRPIREKEAKTIGDDAKNILCSTGYDEVSMCSLSTSDYSKLPQLMNELLDWTIERNINISLPSLRVDNFPQELLEKITKIKKPGLTFAPEAGTQRLRNVINKNICEEDVLLTCKTAFEGGYTTVKLYFMMGLPTETDEDILGIAKLAQKVVDLFYSLPNKPKGKGVTVNISVACFVPKPFTPFEFVAQDTPDELRRKQRLLRESITSRKISMSYPDSPTSMLEAVLARGDRRVGAAIENCFRMGGKLDGWDEYMSISRWLSALEQAHIDPAFYASRKREYDEILPWDMFDYGVGKSYLIKEYEKALSDQVTHSCQDGCNGCGAQKLSGGECAWN